MKKQSKILIISHQYLPHVSPRTTRWKLIIEELTNRGHEVTLLTGTYPDFENKNINVLYFGNKNNLNIVSVDDEKSIREWQIDLVSGKATLTPMFDSSSNWLCLNTKKQLTALNDLYKSGALSGYEFEKAKKKLLDN